MLKKNTDEELIVKIVDGDKDLFAELIDRYQIKLMRYIVRITNVDTATAEHILQDSFIKAYTHLNDFDTSLKFSSWIYRIVHNEVVSLHRKSVSGINKEIVSIEEHDLQNIIDSTVDIPDSGDIHFIKDHIQKALQKLDYKYKEVIILRYFEHKDYKEISDILKKPINTIATLLSRAKKQLKKEINNLSNNAYENE